VQGWLFARAMPASELAQSPVFRDRGDHFVNQHSRQARSQEKTL
jgi:hypothetical protein